MEGAGEKFYRREVYIIVMADKFFREDVFSRKRRPHKYQRSGGYNREGETEVE